MAAPTPAPPPLAPGLLPNLKFDAVAGFLVFLIAMPLCLAIARASGFPPIAGIWTAVVGGVLCTLISNAQLTIKGPAAGLIVIVYGAVTELGAEFGADLSDADRAFLGYKLALGVGVTAGVIQILLGLVRAGRLADFFPLTPVHGMLASIGLIIIAKQAYEVIGVAPEKGAGPLELYAGLAGRAGAHQPRDRRHWHRRAADPVRAAAREGRVGAEGAGAAHRAGGRGRPGLAFDLEHKHTYLFPDSFFDMNHRAEFEVGPRFLVDMPEVLQNPAAAFAVPDFRGVLTATGIQYVVLFCLIGSLESLLSAKAIELVDPWRRKTNFDRDLLAVGAANTLCAAIGALPMISEIVRSKANIDSGGRTKAANLFHGLFLLGFVLLFPNLIHRIPLAALGAMLVYTGFRLANPVEFVRTYKVGSEQFIVFVGTILATLATDLLIGIGVGMALKVAFHVWHGCSVRGLFTCDVEAVPEGDRLVVLVVRRAAVFSNWLGVRAIIFREAAGRDDVVLDLSRTRLVDHTVMESCTSSRTTSRTSEAAEGDRAWRSTCRSRGTRWRRERAPAASRPPRRCRGHGPRRPATTFSTPVAAPARSAQHQRLDSGLVPRHMDLDIVGRLVVGGCLDAPSGRFP